jgi:hypothetical protein
MKATIEFNLSDPEEAMEHYRCIKATDLAIVLWELSSSKKSVERMIDAALEDDKNIDAYDGADLVYDKLYELLEQYGVFLDKIIE